MTDTRSSAATVDAVAAAIMTVFIKKWFLGSYKGPVYLDCVNGEKAWQEEAKAAIAAIPAVSESDTKENCPECQANGLCARHAAAPQPPGVAQAVPDDAADAARYRHLKEYCSYHYAEGYDPPTPREFGIQWEWIDTTPARPGMDWLIDQEIEAKRLETLEYEAEEAALALPSTDRA